jgi:ParB family transcriptional regulator, chromosome partitioning protein
MIRVELLPVIGGLTVARSHFGADSTSSRMSLVISFARQQRSPHTTPAQAKARPALDSPPRVTLEAVAKKKRATRRKKAEPKSFGLTAAEVRTTNDARVGELTAVVDDDGGAVLGSYCDPFGGTPVLLVALPIEAVEPTPYQRDPSEPHVKRLMTVIEKVGRFLDPVVIVRNDDRYWTPNGNHRLQAMRKLGAKTITGLLVPESDIAFKILALNTEKAHNVKEKSLEVIRMARALAERGVERESDHAFEFEEAPYLTLGAAYERRRSLGGGGYHSVLRRIDDFLDDPLPKAVRERERRATKLLKLDDLVSNVVAALKERGLTSPYLRPFVIARINPIRFSKATEFDFDEVVDKMIIAAGRFNVDRVRQEDVAKVGGAPMEES